VVYFGFYFTLIINIMSEQFKNNQKGLNRVGVSPPHLSMEPGPISEMLCFLVYKNQTMDKVQKFSYYEWIISYSRSRKLKEQVLKKNRY
jgi:hypothetical protein